MSEFVSGIINLLVYKNFNHMKKKNILTVKKLMSSVAMFSMLVSVSAPFAQVAFAEESAPADPSASVVTTDTTTTTDSTTVVTSDTTSTDQTVSAPATVPTDTT